MTQEERERKYNFLQEKRLEAYEAWRQALLPDYITTVESMVCRRICLDIQAQEYEALKAMNPKCDPIWLNRYDASENEKCKIDAVTGLR